MRNPDSSDLPAPVLVIDANEDMEDVPDIYSRHENAILRGGSSRKNEIDENLPPKANALSSKQVTKAATNATASPRKVLAEV